MVGDVHSSPLDISEVSKDYYVTVKKVAVRPLDLQIYRREEVWLTISRVEKVQSLLRGVSQKDDNDSLNSLRLSKHQYGA